MWPPLLKKHRMAFALIASPTVAGVQTFGVNRPRICALTFGPDSGVQLLEKYPPLELVGVVALAVQNTFDVGDGGNRARARDLKCPFGYGDAALHAITST